MKSVDGTRIMLADHHGIVCDCLKNLIEIETDMCVVGQADSGAMALRCARELKPHLIIMDVGLMEGGDGIYAARKISEELNGVRIVGLFGHLRACLVSDMLKAGATGFVSKEHPFSELLQAVKDVLAGRIYLCPKTKDVLAKEHILNCLGSLCPTGQDLSDRELSVLALSADGKVVKEIALALELAPKTVDACRRKLMRRLDLGNTAALVKYAIRTGLTPL